MAKDGGDFVASWTVHIHEAFVHLFLCFLFFYSGNGWRRSFVRGMFSRRTHHHQKGCQVFNVKQNSCIFSFLFSFFYPFSPSLYASFLPFFFPFFFLNFILYLILRDCFTSLNLINLINFNVVHCSMLQH